jgi:hypothetical protein
MHQRPRRSDGSGDEFIAVQRVGVPVTLKQTRAASNRHEGIARRAQSNAYVCPDPRPESHDRPSVSTGRERTKNAVQ